MSWLLIFLLLSLGYLSESRIQKKLPSVVIVGTIYCNTCSDEESSLLISGAHIAVECKDENLKQTFRKEAKTDKDGVFRVHLYGRPAKGLIKQCSVKLIRSNEPYNCGVVGSTDTETKISSTFRLQSREQGSDVFSAGFFGLKPKKPGNVCNDKKFELPSWLPKLPPLPPLPPFPWFPRIPPVPGNMTTVSLG
ncbi:hypothetical protein ACFE04_008975 [Oxalis oulophora]